MANENNDPENTLLMVNDLMRKIAILNCYNQAINFTCQEIIDENSCNKSAKTLALEILHLHDRLLKENFKKMNEKEYH